MNVGYLYSVIDLYLRKEKDNKKANLNIKRVDDKVNFSFNMKANSQDNTIVSLLLDDVNNEFKNILNMYKQDLMIIDEKYDYDNVNNTCYYYVLFKNGRTLSFNGFTMLDINNIRNILFNITIHTEEMRVSLNDEKEMPYKPKLSFQQAGFASYVTIFLIALFFVDVLVIALWICKLLMK